MAAERAGNTVRVRFRITGSWTSLRVAAPVLLREPHGETLRETVVEFDVDTATYEFELPEELASSTLPWVEVRYPRGEKRLVLSEDGRWGR